MNDEIKLLMGLVISIAIGITIGVCCLIITDGQTARLALCNGYSEVQNIGISGTHWEKK